MHIFTLNRLWFYSSSLIILLLVGSCSKEEPLALNVVTPQDDVAIGQSIDNAYLHHIDTLPSEEWLEEADHPDLYRYLGDMCDKVQNSTAFTALLHRDRPIRKPKIRVLASVGKTGAFVAPGGYLYIYTDLLRTLQHEAELIPIIGHLLSCSMHRFDVKKLEAHFSTNFLLDLAIGANVSGTTYAAPSTNVCAIIEHLADKPYRYQDVAVLDEATENIACELGYDIQVYANFFLSNTNNGLDWLDLFSRDISNSAYATHLLDHASDSLSCGGTISTAGYTDFKTLIP
jgi:hypothetical protein